MNPLYAVVALRAGHRCEYCHAPEAVFNFPFEVDHIVPVSRGGSDAEDNLALACRACNLRKAAHLKATDPLGGQEVNLFNPRKGRWEDHFMVEIESGQIKGLTPDGRGAVVRLEMNHEVQVAARLQWSRLGLFP